MRTRRELIDLQLTLTEFAHGCAGIMAGRSPPLAGHTHAEVEQGFEFGAWTATCIAWILNDKRYRTPDSDRFEKMMVGVLQISDQHRAEKKEGTDILDAEQ